jgi:hypothetical protein
MLLKVKRPRELMHDAEEVPHHMQFISQLREFK